MLHVQEHAYIPSLSLLYCTFFCSGFVIVRFYVLCSGLIVPTNTCSYARVEDVHYRLIVKKKYHI
jgi:hypothetical protein